MLCRFCRAISTSSLRNFGIIARFICVCVYCCESEANINKLFVLFVNCCFCRHCFMRRGNRLLRLIARLMKLFRKSFKISSSAMLIVTFWDLYCWNDYAFDCVDKSLPNVVVRKTCQFLFFYFIHAYAFLEMQMYFLNVKFENVKI